MNSVPISEAGPLITCRLLLFPTFICRDYLAFLPRVSLLTRYNRIKCLYICPFAFTRLRYPIKPQTLRFFMEEIKHFQGFLSTSRNRLWFASFLYIFFWMLLFFSSSFYPSFYISRFSVSPLFGAQLAALPTDSRARSGIYLFLENFLPPLSQIWARMFVPR